MADSEKPQLYLITPTQFDFDSFPSTLQRVLDASDIAYTAGNDKEATILSLGLAF